MNTYQFNPSFANNSHVSFNSSYNQGNSFTSRNDGGNINFDSGSNNRSFNRTFERTNSGNQGGHDFAMYPKNDSTELIDCINAKIGQENSIVSKSPIQNQNFLYLKLAAPKNIQEKLLNLTGTSLIDDTNYYFSNIVTKDEEKLSTQINQKFSTELLEGSRLNLSNLSDRLGIPPLNRYTVSFILFLCAIKAFTERCEIKEINFENNAQTDTRGFTHILQLFPDLEKVFFLGNPLSNQNTQIFKPFNTPKGSIRPNVELVIKEPATPSTIKSGWGNISFQQVTNPYQISLRRVIKGNSILSKRPKLVLSNFIPVSINPNDSPIHRFLLAFIDRGWTDLKNIDEYYFQNAVFSLTADICPINSPLSRNFYHTASNRDRLTRSLGKVAVGPKDIRDTQFEIFGGGFYATLTSFAINVINEKICAIVCHGAFHKSVNEAEDIFCFDRSLLVGCEDESILITNDHIFVRAPKLPGML